MIIFLPCYLLFLLFPSSIFAPEPSSADTNKAQLALGRPDILDLSYIEDADSTNYAKKVLEQLKEPAEKLQDRALILLARAGEIRQLASAVQQRYNNIQQFTGGILE